MGDGDTIEAIEYIRETVSRELARFAERQEHTTDLESLKRELEKNGAFYGYPCSIEQDEENESVFHLTYSVPLMDFVRMLHPDAETGEDDG